MSLIIRKSDDLTDLQILMRVETPEKFRSIREPGNLPAGRSQSSTVTPVEVSGMVPPFSRDIHLTHLSDAASFTTLHSAGRRRPLFFPAHRITPSHVTCKTSQDHVATYGQTYDFPTRAARIAGMRWSLMWALRT